MDMVDGSHTEASSSWISHIAQPHGNGIAGPCYVIIPANVGKAVLDRKPKKLVDQVFQDALDIAIRIALPLTAYELRWVWSWSSA